MGFSEAIKSGFSHYVTFTGRATRSEYWYWALFTFLGGILTSILDLGLFPGVELSPLNSLFSLFVLLPSLAVGARRLHDLDKSGWWQLLLLVPLIGLIILIYWFVQRGTEGPNRFGEERLAQLQTA
ncbi:DUF805 domain-containing protein [Telmatospirillum sp. J64-1]|uniref:DUF805 domain-containing protein n=1 Tax=Telmatospirillum sp. J64-1 TaxID=2502183 RepID=UPI00115C61F7|nr:DUF805 domain-containing protein [Telmatospirillum sp. J64-1]